MREGSWSQSVAVLEHFTRMWNESWRYGTRQVLQSEFESVHKHCVAFYLALQCVLGHFTSLLKVGWFLNVARRTCHISEQ